MTRAIDLFRRAARPALILIVLAAGRAPITVAAQPRQDAAAVWGLPWVKQWYSLDCEYAATAAVTWFYGNLVSQRDLIAEVPGDPNPHYGFRGRLDGPVGGLGDYGVYAEPLVPVLQRHGFHAEAVYADAGWLKAQIAAGRPVVVWMTYETWPSARSYYLDSQGRPFSLTNWEHCVVVTAYDDWGVTVMDPYGGTFGRYGWDDFTRAWGYFDGMALLITPGW